MVDTFNHHGLPLSQTRCRHHCKQKELMRMKCRSCSRETYVQWAGSRERISSGLGGRAFFLTSLFIELIELCRLAGCELVQNYASPDRRSSSLHGDRGDCCFAYLAKHSFAPTHTPPGDRVQ